VSDFEPNHGRPIRIGVSACLLGHEVRYDGGHRQDPYLTDTLGRYFQWVPVCPEVEIGLSTPRPTMRLETHNGDIRLMRIAERDDLTRQMRSYCQSRVAALAQEQLCGYVLKKNSPSCGMQRVKVFEDCKAPRRTGRGLFADALVTRYPNLPVEEEGRLHDPVLRDNWITRVFAFHRLQTLWSRRWSAGDLGRFHTVHRFLLMAHSPTEFRELGRIVADAKSLGRRELRAAYENRFMAILSKRATRAKNTNVLHHLMRFFKRDLDGEAKRELLGHVHDYRQGIVPLVVPLTLVAHYVRLLDVDYLREQVYFSPHPKELCLRNEV